MADAAQQLLKSKSVDNETAYYALQQFAKDKFATRGALSQASSGALSAETAAGARVASSKDISSIVSKLPEEQVRAILGREIDTMGQPIKKMRGYLTTSAKRIAETYKNSPGTLAPDEIEIIRALGIIQ